jgi:hypothetical protein
MSFLQKNLLLSQNDSDMTAEATAPRTLESRKLQLIERLAATEKSVVENFN